MRGEREEGSVERGEGSGGRERGIESDCDAMWHHVLALGYNVTSHYVIEFDNHAVALTVCDIMLGKITS